MKNCKKCGGKIPSCVIIKKKKYKINNRNYCLNCHPFKSSKTGRKLDRKTSEGKVCACKLCKKSYKYSRKKGHLLTLCITCKQKVHDKKMKERAIAYKGGKCKKCSYKKCAEALEFHHRDAKKKLFQISPYGFRKSWKILKKELNKCDLLCANCHRETEYAGGARSGT